jgi:hypothetical protein
MKKQSDESKLPHAAEFKPAVTLSASLSDPHLFGKVFSSPSFWTWKVVAKLIDGISLIEQREIALYEECTGKTYNKDIHPAAQHLLLLCGRRAGKDRFLSAVAVWRAALCTDWRKYLSAGEQAVVILLGADKKQAAILRKYCQGLLETPLLAPEVSRTTGEVTEFRNGSSLEISTNDARLVRGRSAIAVLGSECCHWRTDEHSANSDAEIVGAAEPSMAMCPGGPLLLLGSSVHRRKGYMYEQYRKLYGNNEAEDICWFAPSTTMNSKIPQGVVDRALAQDPHKAKAEYLSQWRDDISSFVPAELIEACTDLETFERPPQGNIKYFAWADAAGGLGSDSFTLGIAHRQTDGERVVVLDLVRERKPRFSPHAVVAEFAQVLKAYHVSEVWGDKYAGAFHVDEWKRHGITFRAWEKTTTENYVWWLSLLMSGRARLINNPTLKSQTCSLERCATPAGHEIITHPRVASAHDDVATSVAGVMVLADKTRPMFYAGASWVSGPEEEDPHKKAREQSDSNFRWRLGNYMRSNGYW